MSKIKRINDNARAIHLDSGEVYTCSQEMQDMNWQTIVGSNGASTWEHEAQVVNGERIVPYGANNDLPIVIRNIMDQNHLAPGILERHMGLLYGTGPQLYQISFENGEVVRNYVQDDDVQAWLATWNFRRFVEMAIVEYKYLKGVFVRRYLNKGARIGMPSKIVKLEVIPGTFARLGWPQNNGRRLEDVTKMFVGDFENNCFSTGMVPHPVYENGNPFGNRVAMSYHNTYSFARNFYSLPAYYGALKWIARSSDIPDIIKYLSENGIITAFHIHTPAEYWDQKKTKLEERFPADTEDQIDRRLNKLKDQTFEKMTKVLAGKKNAGKFIETVDFYDVDGNLCAWKIEPIDQKIKDFIESQLKISEMANSATTSGMGLHPSLSNIVVNGQLSSGSQVLYALKNYMTSETSIPEEVIFEPVNQAIAANFPNKKLKVGFHHQIVMKEENVNPDKRVANNA